MRTGSIIFLLIVVFTLGLSAQVKQYGKSIVDTLTSERFDGRGYVNRGDYKAATFISKEFQKLGVEKLKEDYYQKFSFTVNTFPGDMDVSIDNVALKPGEDYLVELFSSTVKGTFKIYKLDKKTVLHSNKVYKIQQKKLEDTFVYIDLTEFTPAQKKTLLQDIFIYKELAKGIILLTDAKLTWGSSQYLTNLPIIEITKSKFPTTAKKITVSIKNEYIDAYPTQNIIGQVKGTTYPDSMIVFTAHYDHLGRMGLNTYFPGANDNAGGVAMLLSLAKKYVKEKSKYTIVFIAFAGEEMGLLGSKYFVDHSMIDLKKIKSLINLDLVGTGDDGIMVVNAVKEKSTYDALKKINDSKQFVKEVKARANAENSDHFPFTKKGVPAIFIYGLGGISAYHDIYDRSETLPLTAFDGIYNLITTYVSEL